jgi:hypothetical protein
VSYKLLFFSDISELQVTVLRTVSLSKAWIKVTPWYSSNRDLEVIFFESRSPTSKWYFPRQKMKRLVCKQFENKNYSLIFFESRPPTSNWYPSTRDDARLIKLRPRNDILRIATSNWYRSTRNDDRMIESSPRTDILRIAIRRTDRRREWWWVTSDDDILQNCFRFVVGNQCTDWLGRVVVCCVTAEW